jgi:hypothetical protein
VLTRAQRTTSGGRKSDGRGGAGTGDEGAGGRVYPRRERKSVTYFAQEQEEEVRWMLGPMPALIELVSLT